MLTIAIAAVLTAIGVLALCLAAASYHRAGREIDALRATLGPSQDVPS